MLHQWKLVLWNYSIVLLQNVDLKSEQLNKAPCFAVVTRIKWILHHWNWNADNTNDSYYKFCIQIYNLTGTEWEKVYYCVYYSKH